MHGTTVLIHVALIASASACATSSSTSTSTPASTAARGAAARDTLAHFLAAIESQRWPEAYALLSARWRARYTPERLAADFGAAGSVSTQSVQRARALIDSPVRLSGETATLQVGEGKNITLIEELGRWRVDALE